MKTSFAKAIQIWEEKNDSISEAEVIKLNGMIPPIDKMEAAIISTFKNCRQLSLSTNCIEKMVTIQGLRNLKILSLGRNQIKKIYGLEDVGENLEELWISYNLIESLNGLVPHCTNLKVLYIAHNKIKDWNELEKIKELSNLKNVVFLGNEIYEQQGSKEEARLKTLKILPHMEMIDNVLVTEKDKNDIEKNEQNSQLIYQRFNYNVIQSRQKFIRVIFRKNIFSLHLKFSSQIK